MPISIYYAPSLFYFLHHVAILLSTDPSSSKNGSPVDPVEAGSLVATIAKKRRADGIGITTGAQFDINVGDGKYINLTDPTSAEDLNDDMKTTALSQLKVLQDQMTSLMAHLET